MNGGLANNANQEQGYSSEDGSIRISSVDANNQLLVRARPAQWQEILGAIKQLDVPPLQVQIETRVFEVDLTGDLEFGVQWYLQGSGRRFAQFRWRLHARQSGSAPHDRPWAAA